MITSEPLLIHHHHLKWRVSYNPGVFQELPWEYLTESSPQSGELATLLPLCPTPIKSLHLQQTLPSWPLRLRFSRLVTLSLCGFDRDFFSLCRQGLLTLLWVLIEPSSCLCGRCIKSLSTIENSQQEYWFFLQFLPDMVITDNLDLCMLK